MPEYPTRDIVYNQGMAEENFYFGECTLEQASALYELVSPYGTVCGTIDVRIDDKGRLTTTSRLRDTRVTFGDYGERPVRHTKEGYKRFVAWWSERQQALNKARQAFFDIPKEEKL